MSNAIDSIVSKSAQEQLDKLYRDLNLVNSEIVKINQTGIKFNDSASPKNLTELVKATEAYTKAEKEQAQTLLKNEQIHRSLNATIRSEISTKNAVTRESEKQRKATENLNSAYVKLSMAHARASRTLQDLIASERASNSEIRKAQNEFNKLNSKILSADKAVGRFNRNVGNYPKNAILGLKNLIGAFGIIGGVSLFANIVKDTYRLSKELQGLSQALKQVTGTQEEYLKQQVFLKQIASDFGVEINGLTQQFTQFYVSAKNKIAGNDIQQIFKSITKAGATMGLSVDAQQRAFLALNQMMSKGVVSAEELRGQLGEALPGAFGIMAKALNTNEIGLNKMLKSGSLLANEVLPKFAKELEKAYGIENVERIDNLTSAQNRLQNSWTNLIRTITEGEGGITSFLGTIVDEISKTISAWDRLLFKMKSAKTRFSVASTEAETFYFKQIQSESEKTGISVENLAKTRIGLAIKMKDQIKSEIDLIKAQNAEMTKSIPNKFVRDLSGMSQLIESNNDMIKDKIEQLGRVNGQLKAYISILKPATKEEILNTESLKENNEYRKESIKIKKEDLKSVQDLIKLKENENDSIKVNLESLERQIELYNQTKKSQEELKKWSDDFRKSFQNDFISSSGFDKLFFLIENFDKLKESGVDTALAISEAFQQAFNTISEASQGNFDAEYSRLEQQKEITLKFAGESTTAREEIERQYEEKKRAIARREAEAQKRLAIFNIAIDTAQAIVAALPNVGLSIAIGAIGAIQAGIVASQQIPQFWKGTDNAPEGLAWTQEKGAEVITDKKGKVKTYGNNKGAQLTYLKKGDKVYKSREDYINKVIGNIGVSPLGSYANTIQAQQNSQDFSGIENKISKLADSIKNQEPFNITMYQDKTFVRQGARELANARQTIKARRYSND